MSELYTVKLVNGENFYTGGFESVEGLRDVLKRNLPIDGSFADPTNEWSETYLIPEHIVAIQETPYELQQDANVRGIERKERTNQLSLIDNAPTEPQSDKVEEALDIGRKATKDRWQWREEGPKKSEYPEFGTEKVVTQEHPNPVPNIWRRKTV